MKILKALVVAFSIIGAHLISNSNATGASCNEDYECGVGYPYASCSGGLNVYPGIGLDSNGNVLIAGKFNSSQGGPFGNPSIFEIPKTSDGTQISKKLEILGEVASGAGSFNLFSFYDYIPSADYYYVLMNQAGAPIFSLFTSTKNTVSPVFNVFNTPFVPTFDNEAKSMYYGAYGIFKFDQLPTQKSDSSNSITVYKSQVVNGLSKDGNDLYMSTYDGTFLKGKADCLNCEKDTLILLGRDPAAKQLTDFISTGDNLYYSHANGISVYPKSGNGTVSQLVTGVSVTSLVSDNQGTIYYTTSTGIVKSIGTDGSNGKTLYTPTSNHQCNSAPGFSSTDGVCNGKVLWYNGVPTCTPIRDGGVPEICFNSNDCGSTPYFVCNGKCSCVSGFTGSDCTQCDGHVEWINGTPSCQKSN